MSCMVNYHSFHDFINIENSIQVFMFISPFDNHIFPNEATKYNLTLVHFMQGTSHEQWSNFRIFRFMYML